MLKFLLLLVEAAPAGVNSGAMAAVVEAVAVL
jgi:hypothetical protein